MSWKASSNRVDVNLTRNIYLNIATDALGFEEHDEELEVLTPTCQSK